jgi:peptide/nickel transport system ATP-binding protein
MADVVPGAIDSPPLLEIDHVRKSFPGGARRREPIVAVDDVTLDLPSDRPVIAAIAGESGSGKSTLGHLVLGLMSPTAGRLRFRGRPIDQLVRSDGLAFRRQVQAIFQDPADVFNPFYRVDHVFDMLSRFRLAASADEGREQVRAALRSVGLDPDRTLGRYAHELSGGQAQRLMIARVLLLRPSLIVADEPVSMVDASLRVAVLDAMVELKEKVGASILYITHDLATAYRVSDEIFILHRGRIVERGSTRTVIDAPTDPYTRLLVDSVPEPDPDVRWRGRVDDTPHAALGRSADRSFDPTVDAAFDPTVDATAGPAIDPAVDSVAIR